MGDPRHFKNKYESPKKLWDMDRVTRDTKLKKEYGLRNSREAWLGAAELKKYRREARRLLSISEEERKTDVEKIMAKLNKFGILPKQASLDDVLSLETKDILERRLQTRVFRKGLARTLTQARQLITHGFIALNGRKVTVPSYMVTQEEDASLAYARPINIEVKKPVSKEKPESSEGAQKPEPVESKKE